MSDFIDELRRQLRLVQQYYNIPSKFLLAGAVIYTVVVNTLIYLLNPGDHISNNAATMVVLAITVSLGVTINEFVG